MQVGMVVLGGLGAFLGLAAAWFAAGSGAVAARLIALAALSCLVALLGLGVAARGRALLGAVLLAEAPLGLAAALGQHALVPGALLLSAAGLACLTRPGTSRGRLRRRGAALRLG